MELYTNLRQGEKGAWLSIGSSHKLFKELTNTWRPTTSIMNDATKEATVSARKCPY